MNLDALVKELQDIYRQRIDAGWSEKKALNARETAIFKRYSDNFYIVPGDEEDFKNLTGLEVEIFNLPGPQKGLIIGLDAFQLDHADFGNQNTYRLMHLKVVGMINTNFTRTSHRFYAYGFPVVLKSNTPSEEQEE